MIISTKVFDKSKEIGFKFINENCIIEYNSLVNDYKFGTFMDYEIRIGFDGQYNLYYSMWMKASVVCFVASIDMKFKTYDDNEFIYYLNETFSDIIRDKKINKILNE